MKKDNLNLFEKSTEAIGDLQIFMSPFLIGVIIAAIIYFPNLNTLTLVLALVIILLGIIIGKISFKNL